MMLDKPTIYWAKVEPPNKDVVTAAQHSVTTVTKDLLDSPPRIEWVMPAANDDLGATFNAHEAALGWAVPEKPDRIYLRADLDVTDARHVAAHECSHHVLNSLGYSATRSAAWHEKAADSLANYYVCSKRSGDFCRLCDTATEERASAVIDSGFRFAVRQWEPRLR